jgi:hypothetical protein
MAAQHVSWVGVGGDTHALLARFRTWQRLAIRFTLSCLDPSASRESGSK